MEKQILSKEQEEALEESLARGQGFEELIRTNGWQYIKAWYQAKIQLFASAVLLEGTKLISEFENERRELIGIRKLIGLIDNDIKTFHDSQEKNEKTAGPAKK